MGTVKHMPEPWRVDGDQVKAADGESVMGICDDPDYEERDKANAARIVVCVNTMAGRDPALVENEGRLNSQLIAAFEYLTTELDQVFEDVGDHDYVEDVRGAIEGLVRYARELRMKPVGGRKS